MITKEIIDNQLFVYYNGELIYKRWLSTGQSVVFENVETLTWSHEQELNNAYY